MDTNLVLLILFNLLWIGAVIYYLPKLAIYGLSQIDAIFTPAAKTGKFKFSVRQQSLKQILDNVPGWKIDPLTGYFIPLRHGEDPEVSGIQRYAGARLIGIPPIDGVKTLKSEWYELGEQKEGADNAFKVNRREIADLKEFLFQFTFVVPVKKIEIKGNIQVNMDIQVTVWILAPVTAFFTNTDWHTVAVGRISALTKGWCRDQDFDDIKKQVDKSDDALIRSLREMNGIAIVDGVPIYTNPDQNGLFSKVGVAIVQVAIYNLEAYGKAAEAIEKEKIAELEGNAKVMEEKKKADAAFETIRARTNDGLAEQAFLRGKANGEADRVEIIAGKMAASPEANRLVVAEAIRDSQLRVVGGNTATILDIGGEEKAPKP